MNRTSQDLKLTLDIIREIHEGLPFNHVLGLKVDFLRTDSGCFSFSMRDELVGNISRRMLHGGVVSAALDATGGITACASAAERLQGFSREEIAHRIALMGTIDMRVDYLRPGKGTAFTCKGTVMRSGRKVAVIRMELLNQDDLLIAAGTGAYLIA